MSRITFIMGHMVVEAEEVQANGHDDEATVRSKYLRVPVLT